MSKQTIPLVMLTLWPEESHVNRSLSQASEEARRMAVTSGRKLLPLCKDTGPLGCFSKTFLVSSIWHSTSYTLIWKAQATKAGRMYFRLAPLVPRTRGNESLCWRTPQAADHKSAKRQYSFQRNLVHQISWPTPVARDSKRPGRSSKQHHLSNAVRSWPTPTAIDCGSGRINRSISAQATLRPTLALMARKALWPTPTHRDYKSGTGAQPRAGHPPPLTDVLQGNLNPDWVEALMGLPIGWTALDGPPNLANHKMRGSLLEPSPEDTHIVPPD